MDTDDDVETTDQRTADNRTVDNGTVDNHTVDERGSVPRIERPSQSRYNLGERIGRGGMGEVLAARDEQIGRDVAVKRLRARDPDERTVERFLREACIQGRLQHPAIPPVHEVGRDDNGLPFFVMKKLSGITLAQILAMPQPREQFARQRVLRAFTEVCLAIEFARVRGVIHRDLKPSNIMLGDFGEVYVLDWGVAKLLGESELADDNDRRAQTNVGAIVGTPAYMAPEQLGGVADLDHRADVYALGRVLFDILEMELDPPPELDAVACAATATNRDERIATARELGDRVQRYLDGDRDLALRRSLAREHFERSHAAFAAGGVDDRAHAMREAARALALDPTLVGPAELMSRIMLDPPRETPREVDEALAGHDRATNQRQGRAAVRVYLAAAAFMPFLIGYRGGPALVITFAVVVAVSLALAVRRARVPGEPNALFLSLRNATIVALLARFFSPFLIAPSVALLSTLAPMFTSTYARRRAAITLVVVMTAAVLGPWLLEAFGVLAPTLHHSADQLCFDAAVVGSSPTARMLGFAAFTTVAIAFSANLAYTMQRAERAARRKLELQAWQLRQLVIAPS